MENLSVEERRTCWAVKKGGNGVSFSKPRTPLYHRIHKFKSSVVKSIVDSGVNSRFIHSDPDLIRTQFMASTTPPQIAVATLGAADGVVVGEIDVAGR